MSGNDRQDPPPPGHDPHTRQAMTWRQAELDRLCRDLGVSAHPTWLDEGL